MNATTIHLPTDINKKLTTLAQEQYISKNSLVLQILKKYFDRKKEEARRSGQSRKTQENARYNRMGAETNGER